MPEKLGRIKKIGPGYTADAEETIKKIKENRKKPEKKPKGK